MAAITEDYVSFETAKLLKEKGFNEECFALYNPDGVFIQSGIRLNNTQVSRVKDSYTAPTQQMAMHWLREIYKIGIFPSTYTHISDKKVVHSYGTAIINLKTYKLMTDNYLSNDTYEQAVEAGIKYCLENLI